MTDYIATFYAHIGAIRFAKQLKERGIRSELAPVPRKVSSSCGTCVMFSADTDEGLCTEDVEKLFRSEGGGIVLVYSSL